MSKIRYMIYLLYFANVLSLPTIQAQTHYAADGYIGKIGGGRVGDISTGKQMFGIKFTPSETGELLYLELADIANIESKVLSKNDLMEFKNWSFKHPSASILVLHITDEKGTSKSTIPVRIEAYVNKCQFLGKRLVVSNVLTRRGDVQYFTIIDRKTYEVFTFKGGAPGGVDGAGPVTLSPNEKYYAYALKCGVPAVFLNGKQILPFRDKSGPYEATLPVAEFKKKIEKLRKFPKTDAVNQDYYLPGTQDAWSDDGKFFILYGSKYLSHRINLPKTKGGFLVINAEKAMEDGAEIKDYVVEVPYNKSISNISDLVLKVDAERKKFRIMSGAEELVSVPMKQIP